MPNHIANIFEVTGPKEEVARFKEVVYRVSQSKKQGGPVFDFHKTIPMPKELEGTTSSVRISSPELIEKYGADNWYDWAIRNFGTKWGAYDADKAQKIPDGYRFFFNTAWASPDPWIVTTSKMFPTLTFKDEWKDEGGGAGVLTVKNGEGNEEILTDHEWYLRHDTEYQEEFTFITEGDYDEVIKEYLKKDEGMNFGSLGEHLLARIKDEDLPLFIHFEWWNSDEKEYQRRLRKE